MKETEVRILQVIDRLEIGGAERVFLDVTYLLLKEKVHVDTLLISDKGALYDDIDPRAGRYFLNRKWKFNPFKMFVCASICSRYQIVHVHMRHTYAYVRLAQIISFKKFRLIFHDHYGDTGMNRGSLLTLTGLFKPEYYIGVSQHLVNWAVTKLQMEKTRVFLLRNTVIPSKETVRINKRQDLIIISNVRAIKNLELAIELANKLRKNLTIYGNALPSGYCEKIIESIGNSPYIELIQGETRIQCFMENYTLAIHTSRSETGPLVLLEYLAKGLPFLAHATGEVAHVLKDELPECFISSLNAELWFQRIGELLRNPPTAEKLKTLFDKHFGTNQYSQQCLAIYKLAVSS